LETFVPDFQLSLDFETAIQPEPSAKRAEAEPCAPPDEPRPDTVAAALFRRSFYAGARERQAVSGRHAMPEHQVIEVAASLRAGAEAGNHDAIKAALAATLGIPREVVDEVTLAADLGQAVWVDIDRGCAHHDYSRIFTMQAARPGRTSDYRPATWIHAKPLARYLADALRSARAQAAVPSATTIGALLPTPPSHGSTALADLGGYKLRATMARFQAALPVLLLDAGIDRMEAAFATGAMYLLPRARLYYAQTDPERLHAAYAKFYELLGWDAPADRVDVTTIGPATVPKLETVKRVHDAFQAMLKRRPPTGCSLRTLRRYHNRFMLAAGLALTFCTGARAMRRIGISARYWWADIDHVEFDDKVDEEGVRLDVVLCRVARETLSSVYAHLHELCSRLKAHRGRVPKQWLEFVSAALRHEDVPLLTLLRRRHARGLGTGDLRRALRDLASKGNWGRQFWQSELHLRGLSTEDIDLFARHVVVGAEVGSSTHIEPRRLIQQRITRGQDAVLDALSISAPHGLGCGAPADTWRIAQFPRARVRARRDDAGRTLVSLGRGSGVSDRFVDALVHSALRGTLCDRTSPAYRLWMQILDGIALEDDLRRAWTAVGDCYRDAGVAAIEWVDAQGRLQRRHLSPTTVLALEHGEASLGFDRAVAQLLAAIERTTGQKLDLNTLLDAVATRMASVLPGDLAAHVNGFEPLTAVDRRCLARLRTDRALAKVAARNADTEPATLSLRARLRNAVFSGVGHTAQSLAREFVDGVIDACRHSGTGSEAGQRRRMLEQLTSQSANARTLGGWFAIILDWLLEFVAQGTRRTSPFAPSSIDSYVSSIVLALLTALAEISVESIQEVDWAEVRRSVLAQAKGQPGHASAAFTAFHEYLVNHFGVEGRAWPRDDEGEPHLPRAQVVWPKEIARVQAFLDAQAGASRFELQLAAVFGLASSSAIREQDWRRCRMDGVALHDGHWYVTLDPRPGPDDGKTLDARRTMKLSVGAGAEAFGRWITHRRSEGAAAGELMFGDPANPLQPFEPGATIFELNRLLKEETGEPLVSFHSLRHTSISNARVAARSQREWDEVGVRAGHASNKETGRSYMHLYEGLLRQHLDNWLQSFDLTEAEVCSIAAATPGTLRQRWCRAQAVPRACVSWQFLTESSARVPMQSVDQGVAMTDAKLTTHDYSLGFTLRRVVAWMRERAEGADDSVIALKYDLADEGLKDGNRLIRRWHRYHGNRSALAGEVPLAPPSLPFVAGLRRVGQDKLRPVLQYLSSAPNLQAVEVAVEAWLNVLDGERIDLSDGVDARDFVALLKASGVSGHQIVLHHTDEAADVAAGLAGEISDDFGQDPVRLACSARSERSEIYLGLRAADETSPVPAATSVKGLNALLFCAWLYVRLCEQEQHHE
jgi:hypothetical protein